ncbi:hypothetical protein BT96DRAFT_943211 [Gymnopus androsaceus JB14]|uniref:Uncharacterized protein n=1 Tax=Gymnopus androsaceus JB14 TaxID=1447944 RepID=A0A6A4H9H5_9AGAR|nr:hypothetical protein BT96DRAFT_943211 [Gymnopus androsaceus JB14]
MASNGVDSTRSKYRIMSLYQVNPPGSESLMRGEGMRWSKQNAGRGKGKDEILTLSSLLDKSLSKQMVSRLSYRARHMATDRRWGYGDLVQKVPKKVHGAVVLALDQERRLQCVGLRTIAGTFGSNACNQILNFMKPRHRNVAFSDSVEVDGKVKGFDGQDE